MTPVPATPPGSRSEEGTGRGRTVGVAAGTVGEEEGGAVYVTERYMKGSVRCKVWYSKLLP